MKRRPPAATLLARAITGLITVWCLGCSGYEPLLDSLLGRTEGMTCASQAGEMAMSQSAGNGGEGAPNATISTSSAQRGFDCGCGSCHAASPQSWNVQLASTGLPSLAALIVVVPVSVSRSPIAPPPETRAS